MPQWSSKESDCTSVRNVNLVEEALDPTQSDSLPQEGICPEDRQSSLRVFKFVSTRRRRRASKHHLTGSRRSHIRSMDVTSCRRKSRWFINKVNMCRSPLNSRRKRKVEHTLPDDIPHIPPKKRIGLSPPLRTVVVFGPKVLRWNLCLFCREHMELLEHRST